MNRIKELRTRQGWTQAELSEKMKTGANTVSRYETEQRQLDPATIGVLCDIFGCTADYLLGRSENSQPVLSDADAEILAAYHAADQNIRDAVDLLLRPAKAEKKKAG